MEWCKPPVIRIVIMMPLYRLKQYWAGSYVLPEREKQYPVRILYTDFTAGFGVYCSRFDRFYYGYSFNLEGVDHDY